MATSRYEELSHHETRFGELVLRRRRVLSLDADVYEVKIGGEFLMSSLVNDSEIALARLGLDALAEGLAPPFEVVVGGLGLGYTARAALDDERVAAVTVVEALEEVIAWHREGRLPLDPPLATDPRCRLAQADLFALAAAPAPGLDPSRPGHPVHALLLDVDHAPDDLLHPSHGSFYTTAGLDRLNHHLVPGGVFALWSSQPPEHAVTARLAEVFDGARAEAVTFHNPLLDRDDVNTIYLARTRGDDTTPSP